LRIDYLCFGYWVWILLTNLYIKMGTRNAHVKRWIIEFNSKEDFELVWENNIELQDKLDIEQTAIEINSPESIQINAFFKTQVWTSTLKRWFKHRNITFSAVETYSKTKAELLLEQKLIMIPSSKKEEITNTDSDKLQLIMDKIDEGTTLSMILKNSEKETYRFVFRNLMELERYEKYVQKYGLKYETPSMSRSRSRSLEKVIVPKGTTQKNKGSRLLKEANDLMVDTSRFNKGLNDSRTSNRKTA